MNRVMRWSRLAMAVLITAGAAGSANADLSVGDVKAGYNGSADTTDFTIDNTSGSTLSNISITGTNVNGTSTVNFGNILAGSSGTYSFFLLNGSAFQADYDDYYSDHPTYTLNATSNGVGVSTTFTELVNATNGFVGFLGNNPDGSQSDLNVKQVIVGNISNGAIATPEPSTLVSAGMAGLMGLGYAWRRRKAKPAA